MEKRKLTTVFAVVGVIGLALAASSILAGFKEEKKSPPRKAQIKTVQVQKVKNRTILSSINGSGRVSSLETFDLVSEVSGKILKGNVLFKKGQSFKKGDLLVKIYDQEAKLALYAKKSRFLNTVANILPDYKIDFTDRFETLQNFFNSIDIKKDLPPLPEPATPKEKIFLASRNILNDYYSIKSDEIKLKKYYIRAPFSGSFTKVSREVGSIANMGTNLARIIRTDILEIEVPVPAEQAVLIKKGYDVVINSSKDLQGASGKVSRISSFVVPETHSISIYVAIDGSHTKEIYQGQYYNVSFPGISFENAIKIPRSALVNGKRVFTVDKGKLKLHEISIVKRDAEEAIINGLPDGTLVVTQALINPKENTPVRTLEK